MIDYFRNKLLHTGFFRNNSEYSKIRRGQMIYDSKLNYSSEFDNSITSPYITFTGKADISVKDEYCAVSVANDYVARHIVLNNNITVTCNNLNSDIWGVDLEESKSDKEPTIYSNNAAKNTKITVKTDFSRSAYGWSSSYYMSLKIGGAVMLHNFNISVTAGAADIYARGIQAQYLKSLIFTIWGDFKSRPNI